jgi:hypothetical protein
VFDSQSAKSVDSQHLAFPPAIGAAMMVCIGGVLWL